MTKRVASLSKDEVERVLSELDYLVVSVDRIGSAAEGDQALSDRWLVEFFDEANVFKRLAEVRSVISGAYERSFTNREEFHAYGERAAAACEPWRPASRKK